jgi:glycosyltransferase involved in cell wall biosynthesis
MGAAPEPPIGVLEIVSHAVVGGMESAVRRRIEALHGRGFTFSCLCPYETGWTDALRAAGVPVHVARIGHDIAWATLQAALALVREHDVALVHGHLPAAHVLAGLVGRIAGIPSLATIHAMQLSLADLEAHRLTRTHLAVVSEATRVHALALGARSDQVSVVRNGVDLTTFRPEGLRAPLDALGVPPRATVVGFVGRLAPEKDPELFVRGAWAAARAVPRAHFVVVGGGALERAMRTQVRELGLQGRLHFAGEREDMPALYRSFDLLALTSWQEGMPLAVLEAMATGLAVVATDVGGVSELVVPGRTGMLVPRGDADAVGSAIARLASDRALRARSRAAAP